MRVLLPPLLSALLLALPHACDNEPVGPDVEGGGGWPGSTQQEGDGPVDPALIGPIEVAPLGGPTARATLRIEAEAASPGPAEVPLTIEGFLDVQLGPKGMPRANAVPSFRWASDDPTARWPLVIQAEVPADGERLLVAWLDLDGSGRLDEGDLCSAPVIAPDAEARGELAFRIDRPWLDEGAAGGGSPSGRPVVLEAASGHPVPQAPVGLLVLGFPAAGIGENGYPLRGTLPSFQWKQPPSPLQWPVHLDVPIEGGADLWLFGVLDLDGDQRLGPGDHLAGPVQLPERGETVLLRVDRTLPSRSIGPRGCRGGEESEPPEAG